MKCLMQQEYLRKIVIRMIEELLIISLIVYIAIAFAWYCIFTYQFNFRVTINVGGETLQKDFKGLELAIICLAWIVIFPFAIKQMKKNNEEE